MDTYNNRLTSPSSEEDVETLNEVDILIGDRNWVSRGLIPKADADLISFIVEKWYSGGISATEALKWLDNEDLLDPNDLMLGLAAVEASRAPLPPSPAIALPLPDEWPYGDLEALSVLSKVRVA